MSANTCLHVYEIGMTKKSKKQQNKNKDIEV
jgi:hypothetical protein